MEIRHKNRQRIENVNEFKAREIASVKEVANQVSRMNQGFDVQAKKYTCETGGKTNLSAG